MEKETFLAISIISLATILIISRVVSIKGLDQGHSDFWVWRTMHFLGGFFVAMFFSGFVDYLPLIIALTFLVGVAWELYEYFWGIYKYKKEGTRRYMTETRDTLEDLLLDILGAIIWIFILFVIL